MVQTERAQSDLQASGGRLLTSSQIALENGLIDTVFGSQKPTLRQEVFPDSGNSSLFQWPIQHLDLCHCGNPHLRQMNVLGTLSSIVNGPLLLECQLRATSRPAPPERDG
jgi:hypothetical protein